MNPLARKLILDPLSKLFSPLYSGIGTIIYLDQIIPRSEKPRIESNVSIEITPDFFEQILDFFERKGYQAISLDTLHAVLTGEEKLNRKFVAYTFDDGYLSNYTTAWKIFQHRNTPFCINICTSFIEGDGMVWWYDLEDLLMASQSVSFEHHGTKTNLPATNLGEKTRAFDHITDIVRKLGVKDRDPFLNSLFETHDRDPHFHARETCLNWAQVEEMAKDPLVTFGAHTVNHHNFTCLTDDEIKHEVGESKRIIEERLNQPVHHFAYPFGNRNAVTPKEATAVSDFNFKTLVTTRKANVFHGHRDHLNALPRVMLSGNYSTLSRLERYRNGSIPALNYNFQRVVTF